MSLWDINFFQHTAKSFSILIYNLFTSNIRYTFKLKLETKTIKRKILTGLKCLLL
jgi:hypothetical protein